MANETNIRPASGSAGQPAKSFVQRPFLLVLLLVATTFAVYCRVCRQDFVDWDDTLHVLQNPYFHPIDLANQLHFWRTPYRGLYAPISYTAFALLGLIGRLTTPIPDPTGAATLFNPHVFHAGNLCLHAANVVMVFLLLRRMVKADWPAFAGAMLFAVHPIQVESVAWISELRGLLCALLSLIAIYQYLAFREWGEPTMSPPPKWRYALASAAFLAALLSKPSAVCVPLVAFAFDYWLCRRPPRQSAALLAPWAIAAVPILLLTRTAQSIAAGSAPAVWQRGLVAGDAITFYLSKLIWPVKLAIDYGRTPHAVLSHAWVFFSAGVAAAAIAAAWMARKRIPAAWLAMAVILAAILPVMGLVPFEFQRFSTVADRYMYFGLLGPAYGLAVLLKSARARYVPISASGALAALTILTLAQLRVWDDSETLFRQAVAVNPACWPMHTNYGRQLELRGDLAGAFEQYEEALAISPNDPVAHYNCAGLYWHEHDLDLAQREYRIAIRLNPDWPEAYCDLGQVYTAQNRYGDAIAAYRTATSQAPSLAAAHDGLASALALGGRMQEAVAQWNDSIGCNPDDRNAHYCLGVTYVARGHTMQGISELREALRIDPNDRDSRRALQYAASRLQPVAGDHSPT